MFVSAPVLVFSFAIEQESGYVYMMMAARAVNVLWLTKLMHSSNRFSPAVRTINSPVLIVFFLLLLWISFHDWEFCSCLATPLHDVYKASDSTMSLFVFCRCYTQPMLHLTIPLREGQGMQLVLPSQYLCTDLKP